MQCITENIIQYVLKNKKNYSIFKKKKHILETLVNDQWQHGIAENINFLVNNCQKAYFSI